MKYICDMCGEVLDENDLPTYTDDYGFETGVGFKSQNEEVIDSCSCGGSYVEATECKLCGEYFEDIEYVQVCKDCITDNATIENALRFGDENKDEIKLNSYLLYEFSENQIEEILKRELMDAIKVSSDCDNSKYFAIENSDAFAQSLLEWKEKDKQNGK